MPSRSHDPAPNPAQIRGDLQRGLSADGRPGLDPAIAPLETESGAADAPLTPDGSAPPQKRKAEEGPA